MLHLEKNEYYGGLNSTFNLKDYIEFFEKKDISPTVLEVEGIEILKIYSIFIKWFTLNHIKNILKFIE